MLSSTAQNGLRTDPDFLVLQKSPYLAGEWLSAADITFAALVSMLVVLSVREHH
jgi:hypothetical protein